MKIKEMLGNDSKLKAYEELEPRAIEIYLPLCIAMTRFLLHADVCTSGYCSGPTLLDAYKKQNDR